jgi:hypothetical protein
VFRTSSGFHPASHPLETSCTAHGQEPCTRARSFAQTGQQGAQEDAGNAFVRSCAALQLFPNALLAALPPDEYERIGPDLITVEVKLGDVLHVRDEPIRDVYFPHQGVYSMIMTMADGQRVESACIGNEGMLGIHAFLGEAPASYDTVLQVIDRAGLESVSCECYATIRGYFDRCGEGR